MSYCILRQRFQQRGQSRRACRMSSKFQIDGKTARPVEDGPSDAAEESRECVEDIVEKARVCSGRFTRCSPPAIVCVLFSPLRLGVEGQEAEVGAGVVEEGTSHSARYWTDQCCVLKESKDLTRSTELSIEEAKESLFAP